MSNLSGYYNCKLDAKARLLLPSDFKEQLGEDLEKGFILRPREVKDSVECLEFYTKADWDEQLERMRSKMDRSNPLHRNAIMRYNDGAKYVKIDASGRLQIPKELMVKALFYKEVVITTELVNMVIWDKNRYQQTIGSMSDETFNDIINELIK